MKYNLYYKTDKPILFRENLTHEQLIEFSEHLTAAERGYILVEKILEDNEREDIFSNEQCK